MSSKKTPSDDRATEDQVIAAAKVILRARLREPGRAISSPKDTRDYLTLALAELEHEVFGILALDNRHRVIDRVDLFRGTIDGASVHPREVAKVCLELNAAAVICFHNHPSGAAEPSQSDRAITKRLVDALALIDVRVLDHVVVGAEECVSFAERGWL